MATLTPGELASIAGRFTTDPFLVGVTVAIAERESSFRTDAKNATSSALGLFQVLKGSLAQYGLTSPEQRLDPIASTRGAVNVFSGFLRTIDKLAPGLSNDERAGLIYYGHSEGGGALRQGIAAVKAQGLPVTTANVAAARGRINTGAGLQAVMTRWKLYAPSAVASSSPGSPGAPGAAGSAAGGILTAGIGAGALYGAYRLVRALLARR